MFCNLCGNKKVTVHYTQVKNGQLTELHLCESCAKKQGIDHHFSVSDLLAGMSDIAEPKVKEKKLKCAFCGLTFDDFKKTGRLGCADCFKAFSVPLGDLLKRIHGSQQHFGKTPKPIKKSKKSVSKNSLEDLKIQLKEAVKNEAYEQAAKIRDKIKRLEKK